MCGIVGQCGFDNGVDRTAFRQMVDSLASRGPNGRGVEFLAGGTVALGHSRLSIIDLSSAGRQPMPNEDESVWLTFNGEIYNFRQLRTELIQQGHHFRSQSDSEVIVHGYEQWGDDVVHHLKGIFSFGIWDHRQHRCFLARDHFGVKPLYYWQSGTKLVFASQPRAILQHPEFKRSIDVNAMQNYLAYRYVPHDQAIYEEMNKLPAAHQLVYENGAIRTERYWQPKYRPTIHDHEEAVAAVQNTVSAAVESQLVSDVPVGVFLSGGIDSSCMAAIASSVSGKSLPCFTMGFEEPDYDERSYARLAAQRAQCDLHEDVMSFERFVRHLSTFIELFDEPFFDYSGLFVFLLSRTAQNNGVPVILAGDGGDEIFAGYRWYDDPHECMQPGLLQKLLSYAGRPPRGDALSNWFQRLCQLDTEAQRQLLRQPGNFSHRSLMRQFYQRDAPTVTGLQLLDLQTFLVDDILLKVDHASMACGVEVRVPFLDRSVVETAFSIRHDLLMENGERKSLLKQAMQQWVPNEILTVRKKGFGAPLGQWMKQGLKDIATDFLHEGSLVQRGIALREGVSHLLNQHHGESIWLVLCLELWTRHWLDGQSSNDMQQQIQSSLENLHAKNTH